jgi:hypothetical protein
LTPRPSSRPFAILLLIFAASRILVLGAGTYGATTFPSGREAQPGNVQRPWYGPLILEISARWDSEWYLLIAEEGYHLEERMAGRRVRYSPADATGFFPLYPSLIRAVGSVFSRLPGTGSLPTGMHGPGESGPPPPGGAPYLLAAVLISNLSLLGAAVLLYRTVLQTGHGGEPGTARAALFSAAALLFYPPSLFLSAAYADGLLLFLTLLCFRYLREERWWPAAAAGALASATKPGGALLLAPALLAMAGARGGAGARWRWPTLLLYPAGTLLFSLYCYRSFGDPFSWLQRQSRWRGAASGPWQAFLRWAEAPTLHGAHGSTVELIFAILALVLLVYCVRRRPVAETALAALVVLPPLSSTLWSFGRLSLQAFPLFIVLGCWASRRPAWSWVYFLPAAAGLGRLAATYSAWWWAG